MSKKKRNKPYKGSGAAATRPTITRVQAVRRNRIHQWWLDNSRVAKSALIITGIIAAIILLLIGIVSIFI